MDSIIKLTTEAFDNNNQQAHTKMQECEKAIVAINKRIQEIEDRLLDIPKAIREANLLLLEHTVRLVYFSIKEKQQRADAFDRQIAQARESLKRMIDEKELLAEDYSGTYSYFHDLLGKDELQKLDELYFSNK
jgi:CRISPR/Cas system-associated protein Csx1